MGRFGRMLHCNKRSSRSSLSSHSRSPGRPQLPVFDVRWHAQSPHGSCGKKPLASSTLAEPVLHQTSNSAAVATSAAAATLAKIKKINLEIVLSFGSIGHPDKCSGPSCSCNEDASRPFETALFCRYCHLCALDVEPTRSLQKDK